MKDFIDRRVTMANRGWALVVGLWLLVLAGHVPVVGTGLTVVWALLVVSAVGGIELAYATWYRYLSESAIDVRASIRRRSIAGEAQVERAGIASPIGQPGQPTRR